MKIIDNIKELKENIKSLNGSIGLVPTMGALHDGHKSLIDKAVKENDNVIVSIFVNPIQFCAGEDLDKYPRQLQLDAKLCEEAGVKIIFAPKVNEMYDDDKNNLTLICPSYSVVDKLCGKSRPGHFDGVCSVVAKLFNLTKAHKAYFGQKDAQQLFIIQKMVRDLNFDIEIIPCPIVREKDNLAMSSRNKYLTQKDRLDALNISKALFEAKKLAQTNTATKRAIIDNSLSLMKDLNVEYIEFVDKNTFMEQDEIDKNTLVLIAARTKETNTRLIDNILLWELV
ncbi:MAG: pantoate--beta-alanine ligase [Candidatus Gastranaerophilales bacterium]|nr:pantoate--beta-alanine ligase [Candidatus Gastranaerophilales bacterium]